MSRISFGVVGAGWRTEFYMRIAAAAPDVFETPIVVVRNSAKAALFGQQWGCDVCGAVEDMLSRRKLDFAVTSVPWAPNPDIVKDLVRHGVPVLSETPPAPDVRALIELWNYVKQHDGRVCVAEQYFLRQRWALVWNVGFVGDQQHAAFEAFAAQRFRRPAARLASTDYHEGSIVRHTPSASVDAETLSRPRGRR